MRGVPKDGSPGAPSTNGRTRMGTSRLSTAASSSRLSIAGGDKSQQALRRPSTGHRGPDGTVTPQSPASVASRTPRSASSRDLSPAQARPKAKQQLVTATTPPHLEEATPKEEPTPVTTPTSLDFNEALRKAASPKDAPALELGDRVFTHVAGKDYEGVVEYIGPANFAAGTWVGVSLADADGKNDGSVRGIRYFACEPNHGLFIRPAAVLKVNGRSVNGGDEENEQNKAQLVSQKPSAESLAASGATAEDSASRPPAVEEDLSAVVEALRAELKSEANEMKALKDAAASAERSRNAELEAALQEERERQAALQVELTALSQELASTSKAAEAATSSKEELAESARAQETLRAELAAAKATHTREMAESAARLEELGVLGANEQEVANAKASKEQVDEERKKREDVERRLAELQAQLKEARKVGLEHQHAFESLVLEGSKKEVQVLKALRESTDETHRTLEALEEVRAELHKERLENARREEELRALWKKDDSSENLKCVKLAGAEEDDVDCSTAPELQRLKNKESPRCGQRGKAEVKARVPRRPQEASVWNGFLSTFCCARSDGPLALPAGGHASV